MAFFYPRNNIPAVLMLLIVIFAAVFSGGCGKAQNDKTVIKVATVLPPGHSAADALYDFKEKLEELSGGRAEVRVFLSSQLGGATELIESTRSGNIEMTLMSVAPISQFVPEINALSMPFIFRGHEHQAAVMAGPVGDELMAHLQRIGLTYVGWFDAGSRNVMTMDGPIEKPEDLNGMKIRVMNSKLMTSTMSALGASAIAMDMGEVYSALQTGVIDGWENNPPTAYTFRMYETGCDYYAWTKHLSIPDLFVISTKFLEEQDEDMQEWIIEAAKYSQMMQHKRWQESEQEAIEELEKEGMKFNEVDNSLFAEKVQPLYEEYYELYGEDFEKIVKEIQATDAP